MPRYILLLSFLATFWTVFMVGNLFAEEPETSVQKLTAPQDNSPVILKATDKKSPPDAKLSSTKGHSKLNSARHKTSKKLVSRKHTAKKSAYAGKHHKKHKGTYSRTKLHKTYKHKTRTAKKSF